MFTDGHVEVDGARVRYAEAGHGSPLVHLAGAGAGPTVAHDLLARRFRVIVLETSDAWRRAIESLGLDAFDLMATGEAGDPAIRLALEQPERVRGLVLDAPTALLHGPDLARRLPELTTPTLVVFGTRDRPDLQATGRVYARLIPNGHLAFVYDAGPAAGADRPEAFAEIVGDFFERHEAFIISRTPTVIHP